MLTSSDTSDFSLKFKTQGFVHIPQAIPPDLTERTRRAFDAASERFYPEWQKGAAEGRLDPRFFDIPDILDQDDAFVDLVDLPTVLPVLVDVIGQDLQLNHTHARNFFPGETFTLPWHSDLQHVLGVDLGQSPCLMAKLHLYFEDLEPEQGCLAFLPGTHRLTQTYRVPQSYDSSRNEAVVKVVPRAGDVVLFDVNTRHMCESNRTEKARKSLIYCYSHYWVKHYANAVPSDVEKYATTPPRRQLFGIDDPSVPYMNRRLDGNGEAPWHSSFLHAGKKLLKRTLMRQSSPAYNRWTRTGS